MARNLTLSALENTMRTQCLLKKLIFTFLVVCYGVNVQGSWPVSKKASCNEEEGIYTPGPGREPGNRKEVKNILKKVAGWQLAYYDKNGYPKWKTIEWVFSTYYVGLMHASGILKESKYPEAIMSYAEKCNWKVGEGDRRFFADDYLIGDIYAKLYSRYKRPEMIADFRAMADELIARKSNESLEADFKTMNVFRVWAWCDAMSGTEISKIK